MERTERNQTAERLLAIDKVTTAIESNLHTQIDLLRGQRNARALIKGFDEECSFLSADAAARIEVILKGIGLGPDTAAILRRLVAEIRASA